MVFNLIFPLPKMIQSKELCNKLLYQTPGYLHEGNESKTEIEMLISTGVTKSRVQAKTKWNLIILEINKEKFFKNIQTSKVRIYQTNIDQI